MKTAMTHTELIGAGTLIAQSEMFGKINPASGYMIANICQQQGLSYLEFSETYNWMHNSASMKADAMLAKFCDLGGKYEVMQRTPDQAQIKVDWDGKQSIFKITWTEVEKEPFCKDRNGHIKSNYATPRKRMQSLWSRAVSDAVHTVCPQACKGAYTTEEVETFENDDAPAAPAPRKPVSDQPGFGSVCPIGDADWIDKPWTKFDNETLVAALECEDPAMTQAHKNVIAAVLEIRSKEAKK